MKLTEKDEYFKSCNEATSFDALTKVYNRETIIGYAKHLIKKNVSFSLLVCDVDNFKYVNDTFGHMVGDKVLYECAQDIENTLSEVGAVGRYGGDEFIAVIPNIIEYEDIYKVCRDISLNIDKLSFEELYGSSISFTIGMSRFPINGSDLEGLFNKADKALYRGKQKGRNCFIIYLPEKHDNIDLKGSSDTRMSSFEMHSSVASMLTHSDDLAKNIRALFHYFSGNLMIDHIAIQSNTKMCYNVVYNLCQKKEFGYIPGEYLEQILNSTGIARLNNLIPLEESKNNNLLEVFVKECIGATVVCRIESYGKCYGYLRAETTNQRGRIWQNIDVDLLVVAARIIGILLHYNKLELDDLF